MEMLRNNATRRPTTAKNSSSSEKISSIEKIFSDIGVIIEVSDKRGLNNFSDSKRIRISKEGKVY